MGGENGYDLGPFMLLESGQDVVGSWSGGLPSSLRTQVYPSPPLISEGVSLRGSKCGPQPAAECPVC